MPHALASWMTPSYDPAAVGDVPPAVLCGPDHDLSDLVLPREADDGLGRIVILYLVPAGTEVGGQLSQPIDRPCVRCRAGLADDAGACGVQPIASGLARCQVAPLELGRVLV